MARPISSGPSGAGGFGAGVHIGNSVWVIQKAGVPANGTSGTGAGWAGIGTLYINRTAGTLYQNTGTKASPTWTSR